MECMEALKACRKCGGTVVGRRCAPCWSATQRAYRARHPAAVAKVEAARNKRRRESRLKPPPVCNGCHGPIDRKGHSYCGNRCYDCHRAYMRVASLRHVRENRENVNRRARERLAQTDPAVKRRRWNAWRTGAPDVDAARRHRRRTSLLEAEGSFTAAEWSAIQSAQSHRCAICLKRGKLTVDHVIPLARGGTNYAFNIQALCRPCNARKQATIAAGAQHSLFDRNVA